MAPVRRVVVTGIGVVVPCGVGANELWRNLLAGKPFLRARVATQSRGCTRSDGFDPQEWFDALEDDWLLREDRFVQLGVLAGRLAMQHAGYARAVPDPYDAGIVTSTAVGGAPVSYRKKPNAFPGSVIRREYGLAGPFAALSPSSGTRGLDALGLAFEYVRSGDASLMVAVASEAIEDEPTPALDVRGVEGGIGGGAAVLVLEELEHAWARGASAYAEIVASSSVAGSSPDGPPMVRVIRDALEKGNVDPWTVNYINAHGGAAPQNDAAETNAYKAVFGAHAYAIPISSTKIDLSLSSASLMGAIAAIGSIKLSLAHPAPGGIVADPRCDLDYVRRVARSVSVDTALVTASAVGGIHSATILRKVRERHE